MRLDRLDLLAYGHFTNRTLDFSPPARLHVVYGPNEAGKSTTLAAIIDLLYGYKAKDHPYTFQHTQPLLSGALRAANGATLEFVRKRTTRGAGLTTPNQKTALPDDALAAFLLGVGKDEFERLHGLNHARLRAGGDEMLNPNSDIGRKLFAAGAGLGDLHRVEQTIAADIERIGPQFGGRRGQKGQRLKDAVSEYEAAEKELRAASLKSGDLTKARDRLTAAEKTVATARQMIRDLTAAQKRLERAQRVRPLLAELDQRRTAAGGPDMVAPNLPPDLADQWRAALQRAETAAAAWRLSQQAEQDATAELADAPMVGPWLPLAQPIAALTGGLGEYNKAAKDLPTRQAERRLADDAIADGLRALGLKIAADGVDDRLPAATDIATARDLAGQRRDLRQALTNAGKLRDRAQTAATEAAAALAALGPEIDAGPAEALARDAAQLARAPEQLETAQTAARDAQADADRALAALAAFNRWAGDWAGLATLTPPGAAAITAFETEAGEIKSREKAVAQRLDDQDAKLIQVTAKIAAADDTGAPPSQRAVDEARQHRDTGVHLLAAAAHGAPDAAAIAAYAAASGGDLTDAVMAAVIAADRIADRRTADAKRVQAYEAALAERYDLLAQREKTLQEQAALTGERATLARRWRDQWAPVTAGPAAEMRDWRMAWQTALERRASADRAAGALAGAEQHYQRWATLWRAAADALGLPDDDPAVLASRAQNRLDNIRQQAEQRRDRRKRQEQTAQAADAADADLAALTEQWAALERQWATLTPRLGQPADLPDSALETVLRCWDEIATAVKTRRELDHRIHGMQRDMAAFEARVAALRDQLAMGGVTLPTEPAAAVAMLQAGLETDKQRQTVQEQKTGALAARRRDVAKADRQRQDAADALTALRAAHGLGEGDDVLALCAIAGAHRQLTQAGDGHGEADLRREAGGVDAEAASDRLAELADQLAQAQAAHDNGRTELGLAQGEWDRLQQETGAEAAARRRNDAARRGGLAAEELLQLLAAQALLKRAVERYREENQDPLLSRASALFAAIAAAGGGAGDNPIMALESRVGADSRPVLHAIRRNNLAVGVDALSEGTGDQLFLTLRLAALEQRADAGRPLPFIADDIFMTSDDGRTDAGLRALAELGRTTQVILFTHHAGVAAAAKQAADGAVNLIRL